MTRKCKVIARNAINMVIVYDGVEVQMPTDGTCDKEIYVKQIDDNYSISSIKEVEKENKFKKNKSVAELAKSNVATDDEKE